MSGFKVSEMLKVAKEEGLSTGEKLPIGNYTLEAKVSTVKATNAGNPKISVKWQAVDGPEEGNSSWENLNVPTLKGQDEESIKKYKQATAIFINKLMALGITDDYLNTDPSLEDIAASILGVVIDATVGEKNGWQTFKVLRIVEDSAPQLGTPVPSTMPPFLQGSVSTPGASFLGASVTNN